MEVINVSMNPNDMGSGIVLSNNNLTLTCTSNNAVRATHGKTNGKWYWEIKINTAPSSAIGVANSQFTLTNGSMQNNSNIRMMYYSGVKFPENVTYGSAWSVNDVLGIALNLDLGTLEFFKNGVSMGVSHINVSAMGTIFPTYNGAGTTSRTVTFNFGATPFAYEIPKGFYSYDGRQYNGLNKFLISSEDEIHSIVSYKGTTTAIPVMTSDTVPSGKAFAKSFYNASYAPWKAFNGIDDVEGYASLSGSGGIGYLGYEFPNAISLYKYVVRSNGSGYLDRMPRNWTFEGSNDGVNWNVLDTQTNQTWTTQYTDKIYLLDGPFHYMQFKMYRLNWTANNGFASYTDVNELKMFEIIAPKLVKLPATSESSFVEYGMNKGESIDFASDISSINTINTSSSTLGSGKVFKQKIDTSKIPIKKASIT